MRRFHQLVVISMRDPEVFQRYLAEARPVVSRYGGALDRAVTPDSVIGAPFGLPSLVNLVHYTSEEAFTALSSDQEFQAVLPLRSRSVDLLSIEGYAEMSADDTGLADRFYLIEIARFGEGGREAYQAYADMAGNVMAEYGHRVECRMTPISSSPGWPFTPDLVTVAYFEHQDGLRAFEKDPRHAEFEGAAYARAVQESIWLTGRA